MTFGHLKKGIADIKSDYPSVSNRDYKDQLASSADGTTTITYRYDYQGNRAKQVNGSTTTLYPNDYYSVDGSNIERHIMAGALGSVATSTWDGSASSIVYHHKDHLGGTHVETDESGDAVEYTLYKPYGGTLVDEKTGTYDNDLKYTGKEKDANTGWYYYGARYYNADAGQFMSEDKVFKAMSDNKKILELTSNPIQRQLMEPQKMNSYAYADLNPIIKLDPTGNNAIAAGLFFQSFGYGLEIFGFGADSTIIGIPAGVFIGAVGLVSIGVGVIVMSTSDDAKSGTEQNIGPPPKPEDLEGKSQQEIDDVMKGKGWPSEPTRNGDGTRYPNPNKPGEQVRVQPGNPNDPNPVKQGPYVRISTEGEKTEPIPLEGNPTLNK